MATKYCPLHGIGYNDRLDPVCPQCSVGRVMPPPALEVDENPDSAGFGYPRRERGTEGDRTLPKVK